MSDSIRYFIYLAASGVFLSALFILAVIFNRRKRVDKVYTRKVIHILFAHWSLIPFFLVPHADDILIAIIPPLIFTLLNVLSYRYRIVKAIERDDKKELGTIIYPLSLVFLLMFANFVIQKPEIAVLGAFVLGYGDGLATIAGYRFNKTRFQKTPLGSLTMFLVSSLIIALFIFATKADIRLYVFVPLIGLIATIGEYFGHYGFDNFSVPIFVVTAYTLLEFIVK